MGILTEIIVDKNKGIERNEYTKSKRIKTP